MKKVSLGLAAAAFSAMLTFSGGAQAIPVAAPTGVDVAGINLVTQVRDRRWDRRRGWDHRRGYRCRTVVTRRINRQGRYVVKRVRRCG